MYTLEPFLRYCSTILHSGSEKITTRCHSVFSLRSPVALSRQLSEVATLRLAIGRPSWVRRISGSLPRFPTRITLFTLPAIATLRHRKITGLAGRLSPRLKLRHHPGSAGTILNRPYTVADAASRTIPGYPHIAFPIAMFQFCSIEFCSMDKGSDRPTGMSIRCLPGSSFQPLTSSIEFPESPNKSLTSGAFTWFASVAFRRRYLVLNRVYVFAEIG